MSEPTAFIGWTLEQLVHVARCVSFAIHRTEAEPKSFAPEWVDQLPQFKALEDDLTREIGRLFKDMRMDALRK